MGLLSGWAARNRRFDLGRPDLPYAVQVELTSHCNLHCRMCPLTVQGTVSSLSPSHMLEAHLEDVLALAAKVGHVIIAGFGEPFLSPRCLPFLEELDRRRVWTSIAKAMSISFPAERSEHQPGPTGRQNGAQG